VGVVAAPHPLYGGSIDNPVVIRIERALARAGYGTLAFNWRGVGQSAGCATDDLDCAVLDYRAALEHALRLAPPRVICAGYSFGAGTALLAARDDARVHELIMVAPPLGMLRAQDVCAFGGKLSVWVGDDHEYAPLSDMRALLAGCASAQLEAIRGADHFFHFGGMAELEARLAAVLA
jgi:uncharacterized protein